jgi:hypothetical protein
MLYNVSVTAGVTGTISSELHRNRVTGVLCNVLLSRHSNLRLPSRGTVGLDITSLISKVPL